MVLFLKPVSFYRRRLLLPQQNDWFTPVGFGGVFLLLFTTPFTSLIFFPGFLGKSLYPSSMRLRIVQTTSIKEFVVESKVRGSFSPLFFPLIFDVDPAPPQSAISLPKSPPSFHSFPLRRSPSRSGLLDETLVPLFFFFSSFYHAKAVLGLFSSLAPFFSGLLMLARHLFSNSPPDQFENLGPSLFPFPPHF